MPKMRKRIGFIGLGQQGRPMAVNLCRDGFDLMVHDLRQDAIAELTLLGARSARSPAEAAADAEIVAVIVMDDAQVEIADHWTEFRPGSHGAAVFHKDLTIALEAAEELGLSMPGAALVRELIPRLMG